jgi:hypothetical protein
MRPRECNNESARSGGTTFWGALGVVHQWSLSYIHWLVLNDVQFVHYPNERPERWPLVTMARFIRESYCDGAIATRTDYDEKGVQSDIAFQPYALQFVVPKPFVHRGMIWWTQQLYHYVFRPVLQDLFGNATIAKRVARSIFPLFLEAKAKIPTAEDIQWCLLPGKQAFLEQAKRLINMRELYPERRLYGVHLRRGDSCLPANPTRPICQEIEEYVALVLQTIQLDNYATKRVLIYVASDSGEAITTFETRIKERKLMLDIDIAVVSLRLDRSIYEVKKDEFIESFSSAEDKLYMVADYYLEHFILAQMDILVGQYFSSFINFALFTSEARGYVTVDWALPSLRGGGATPYAKEPQAMHQWFGLAGIYNENYDASDVNTSHNKVGPPNLTECESYWECITPLTRQVLEEYYKRNTSFATRDLNTSKICLNFDYSKKTPDCWV